MEYFQPSGKCKTCGCALPADRPFVCEPCDRRAIEYERAWSDRRKSESLEHRLVQSGLPRDYRTFKRTVLDVPARFSSILQACEKLGTAEVPGLFLFGESKLDKTTIAAAWLAHAIRDGANGRYVNVVDLMTDITSSYNDDEADSRAMIVSRFADHSPLLVLDDLGHEKASHHAGEVIYQILDNRRREWAEGRWLIVTSNRSPEQLRDRFEEPETGNAVLHRIAQLTVPIPMERV